MSDRAVEIEGRPDYGGPFRVGDELTIYEAAMVYSGRHPGGKFVGGTDYGRATIDEYESFLGRGAVDGPRKLAWDIRCEILNRIKARIIEPVRTSFTANGEIDLRDTVIKTADVAALARERNESREYLARWMIVPPTGMQEGAGRPEAKPGKARREREPSLAERLAAELRNMHPNGRPPMSVEEIWRELKDRPNVGRFGLRTLQKALAAAWLDPPIPA